MALLEVERVTKHFGGLKAVSEVSFTIEQGQIVALIGPNGAGKTTVFNMISGIYRPDAGDIRFDGRSLIGLKPHRLAALGIARTFQNLRLFKTLSVFDHAVSGRHCLSRSGFWSSLLRLPAQRKEEQKIAEAAERILRRLDLWAYRAWPAHHLPYGRQKRLEIARALATEPRLLILDEPAGGLNMQEREALVALIREIRAEGVTVLLIEHDMKLVMGLSDRIVVLDNGEKVAEGAPAEILRDPRVIEAYLGREEDEADDIA